MAHSNFVVVIIFICNLLNVLLRGKVFFFFSFFFCFLKMQQEVFQERHDLGGTHGGINHESRSLSGTKEPWGRRQQDIMELELGS